MARRMGRISRRSGSDDQIERKDLLRSDQLLSEGEFNESHSTTFKVQPQIPFVSSAVASNLTQSVSKSRFLFFFLSLLTVVIIFGATHNLHTWFYILFLRLMDVPTGIYGRDGHLYIGKDTRFHIKGVSWFGMETELLVPTGLTQKSSKEIFQFIKDHNFNAIRLPLSVENFQNNPIISTGIGTFQNPDFAAKKYMEVIHYIVDLAAERHLLILLDIHRLRTEDVASPGLWYTDDFPEHLLKETWVKLAREFSDKWNVIGADIYNEPWNATWSKDTTDPDNWKRACEELGEAIHDVCPHWLLFIEGMGDRACNLSKGSFWAENLRPVHDDPPEINIQHKIVLSPHVYGPSVHMQEYFKHDNFTEDLPAIWDEHFGKATNATGLPTVIGEWGGQLTGKDEHWQKKFYKYIRDNEFGFFYWSLNPESGDTGGLLKQDWQSPESKKLQLLEDAPSTNVEEVKKHFQKMG